MGETVNLSHTQEEEVQMSMKPTGVRRWEESTNEADCLICVEKEVGIRVNCRKEVIRVTWMDQQLLYCVCTFPY